MFTTGWAAPRRRSACQTADVLALKAHNLDATTFWFRAPNFGDPAQRHRQFCASSSPTEGTRAGRFWSTRSWSITYFILCSSSRDSAPSFDPASSGNRHVESLGRAIDDQMERASIRAACAFSDGDQLSMSSIGGLAEPARAAEQDSPWHEYRGRGPITKNQVAALLRDYDIRPVVLHPTKRADFSRHGYREPGVSRRSQCAALVSRSS